MGIAPIETLNLRPTLAPGAERHPLCLDPPSLLRAEQASRGLLAAGGGNLPR